MQPKSMPSDSPTAIRSYDLLAIGGGPAGLVAAETASVIGKSAAVIDKHHDLGGAGVNTGTVPSKTLRETALALSGLRSRNLHGVDLSLRREATVADFLSHERNVKASLNAMVSQRLGARKADVYLGDAHFVDPHTLEVEPPPPQDGELVRQPVIRLRGKFILIATGSSPVRPPIFPFGSPGVYDSDTILELDRLPKTLAVVGAGVIGSEYACTFAALGTKVCVIDGRDELLPFLDGELSRSLVTAMMRNGITFHWKENVASCVVPEPGKVALKLSGGKVLTVDEVLVAAGRKSNTETLNLAAAGIEAGDRGLIHVDENYCTKVPHIYAAGDVIGFPALASTRMEQARHEVRHAYGVHIHSKIPHLLPNGIYTIPEASTVGLTEETLRDQGVDYVVGRAFYRDNARGQIIGDHDGFLKLIFRRGDMRLLGVHVMGEQATEVVHIGLMAMLTGSTAELFDEACFNVPTLGGLYKSATLDAMLQPQKTPVLATG